MLLSSTPYYQQSFSQQQKQRIQQQQQQQKQSSSGFKNGMKQQQYHLAHHHHHYSSSSSYQQQSWTKNFGFLLFGAICFFIGTTMLLLSYLATSSSLSLSSSNDFLHGRDDEDHSSATNHVGIDHLMMKMNNELHGDDPEHHHVDNDNRDSSFFIKNGGTTSINDIIERRNGSKNRQQRRRRKQQLQQKFDQDHRPIQGEDAGEGGSEAVRTGPSVRELYEREHPFTDKERIHNSVKKLRKPNPPQAVETPYDIYNCPQQPPQGYPIAWNVLDVLGNWNPDNTTMPDQIYQSLCVFQWDNPNDVIKATNYRIAELPFIIHGHPEIMSASERWNTPGYLHDLLGDNQERNEHSPNNHFMFWRTRNLKHGPPNDWIPPTEDVDMSYKEWLQHAQELENMSDIQQTSVEHWYFRLNAAYEREHTYLYDELPIFYPDLENLQSSFFMIDPIQQRGINCRFGMRGVIAEAHFDPTRNFVILLGPGQRRYILAHPDQCINLELYPRNHPSGRHSSVNWSDPTGPTIQGPFNNAMVNEIIMQAGDALYLPTSFMHFIVSLNINYQCNARSGSTNENMHHIQECGFPIGPR